MPRIQQDGQSSLYQMSDQTFGLSIRHTSVKKGAKNRIKSLVAFTQRAVVPDPLTAQRFRDCYRLVPDRPA
jgi:hypothetical protein